jgi:hypothetical protein
LQSITNFLSSEEDIMFDDVQNKGYALEYLEMTKAIYLKSMEDWIYNNEFER